MGIWQSKDNIGTETFHHHTTNRNFILLYVGGDAIQRSAYILPRTCPLYEDVQQHKFAVSLHHLNVRDCVLNANLGDVVVLAGTNENIDLVGDVADGGVVFPGKLAQMLNIAEQKGYFAQNANHLMTERDREIIEGMVYGSEGSSSRGQGKKTPNTLLLSLNKLRALGD
jgi:hypothetical protein